MTLREAVERWRKGVPLREARLEAPLKARAKVKAKAKAKAKRSRQKKPTQAA